MRIRRLEEILCREDRNIEDVKFFIDFLITICKEYNMQFQGYSNQMFLKVFFLVYFTLQ